MFYEEILIFLAIFLSFCPPTYVHLNLQLSISLKPTKKESFKWNVFFTKFSLFLTKIFAFPFHNFFAKQIEANFAKKSENVCIFCEQSKCKKVFGEIFFRDKWEIFAKQFWFSLKPWILVIFSIYGLNLYIFCGFSLKVTGELLAAELIKEIIRIKHFLS